MYDQNQNIAVLRDELLVKKIETSKGAGMRVLIPHGEIFVCVCAVDKQTVR